jgi:hypothetical protein
MPVMIQRLTSEVDVVSDQMPVSDAMIERIAARVEERLRRRESGERRRQAATSLRESARPPAWHGGGENGA